MGERATGRPGQGAWSSGLDVERRDRVSDGRGMALVITMMAMLTLLALTGALVPLASTETAVVANHRRAIQSFYAAEAALEFIVQELRSVPDWDELLTGESALSSGWDVESGADGRRNGPGLTGRDQSA